MLIIMLSFTVAASKMTRTQYSNK